MLPTSERLYRLLLRLYPAEHRRLYGQEMMQTFRDMVLAAYSRNGLFAVAHLWMEVVYDLAVSVVLEHSQVPRKRQFMSRRSWIVLSLTILLSVLTGYVDMTATEVQAPMMCILLFSFLMGWLQPKGAWRWAALIGLSIPISTFVGLAVNFNFVDGPPRYPITLAVLVLPALAAAYSGSLSKRFLAGLHHHPVDPV